jgi:hypothetical protein
LIISTRRFVSPVSSAAEIVFSTPYRCSAPATKTLGESKRKMLAVRGVRKDFVVARK